jgi:hypothetical protein
MKPAKAIVIRFTSGAVPMIVMCLRAMVWAEGEGTVPQRIKSIVTASDINWEAVGMAAVMGGLMSSWIDILMGLARYLRLRH